MERPDHILIVDDDRDLRELIAQYLQKNGYRVTAAPTAVACATCSATVRSISSSST